MDLNMMMRETARNGLQNALDAAVTNGDTEAARKIAKDIAALEVANAPKAPPFGDAEIRTQISTKASWFGTDPKKSAKAVEFGKNMDPAKFATAEAFADAVIKAVDEEFKPAPKAEESDGDGEGDDDSTDTAKAGTTEKKPRRTDAPGEGDASAGTVRRSSGGPWTKLADAPAEIRKEIQRSADKFVPAKATKEQRDGFIAKALESQYLIHQRSKGK